MRVTSVFKSLVWLISWKRRLLRKCCIWYILGLLEFSKSWIQMTSFSQQHALDLEPVCWRLWMIPSIIKGCEEKKSKWVQNDHKKLEITRKIKKMSYNFVMILLEPNSLWKLIWFFTFGNRKVNYGATLMQFSAPTSIKWCVNLHLSRNDSHAIIL